MLDAALKWREPRIGKIDEEALAAVHGALWRDVMTYFGWELLAKSVLWDRKFAHSAIHPAFDRLLDSGNYLQPPHVNRSTARPKLAQWPKDDAVKQQCLPTFRDLNKRLSSFLCWLVNEKHNLNEQQVLAAMRYFVSRPSFFPHLLKLSDAIRPATCFSSPEHPYSFAGDRTTPESGGP